jgi:hypothetical protein
MVVLTVIIEIFYAMLKVFCTEITGKDLLYVAPGFLG